MDFRSGSNNEGKDDWFVPSCGELAYIFLKKTELNTLLGKVSGSAISSNVYWSSSEYNTNYVWLVGFSGSDVSYANKVNGNAVRLVRAI